MNMYELNQEMYTKLPSLSIDEIQKCKNIIKNYLSDHSSKYYLMLNNDTKYYTMYTFVNKFAFDKMADEILTDIIGNFDEVKSIELSTNKQAIEVWAIFQGDCHVFYLFDYAKGVIEV